MKTEIYVLKDELGIVRYVGKTSESTRKRFCRHLKDARDGLEFHKARWIRSMMDRGLLPSIEVIETVSDNGSHAEIEWISFFRSIGVDLTNVTDGGEGALGHKHTEAQKAALSDALKKSFEHRPQWNKGISPTAETVKKMSQSRIGVKFSEEHKAAISRGKSGVAFSEEHKKALSNSHSGERHKNFGKTLSAETRARISRSVKEAHRIGAVATPKKSETTGRFERIELMEIR